MPIYTYTCKNCKKEFDKFIKNINNKQHKIPCPDCKELAERKTVNRIGLIFKGGGWTGKSYDG